MPQTKFHGPAGNWPITAQISLITSRPHVCSLPPPSVRLHLLTSHSHDLFDEYTRRQYISKAPDLNPFSTDEAPIRFVDFDIFTKVSYKTPRPKLSQLTQHSQIRVLHQMTQFIMMNPDKLRERTEEQKDTEQTNWVSGGLGIPVPDCRLTLQPENRTLRLGQR